MLYVKTFCGNYYHRAAYTVLTVKKRKRTVVSLKQVFGFPVVKEQ